MSINWSASAGGSRPPNPSSARDKRDSTESAEFQFSLPKIEAQPQEDSNMHENIGQGASRSGEMQREEAREEVIKCYLYPPPYPAPKRASLWSGLRSSSQAPSKETLLMQVPACMTGGSSKATKRIDLLRDTKIRPPVTTTTLQELDLHSIQNNLNLRIDICHDPELFFQPISGRKGDEKRDEAKRYWSALVAEFQIYLHNAQPECVECQLARSNPRVFFETRLPSFFNNLREIVQMLVPESDHEEVADHIDTDLLVQQVRVGVMDAIRLSDWLAKLLTSHCAPMRDASATAVTKQIQLGSETADMGVFVEGLEKLFGLLESMKLDIANHQIRSFRYPLIEGTVEFQQDCFSKAIETQQMDIAMSQRWYQKQCFNHSLDCGDEKQSEENRKFSCFIHGLVHLCNLKERKVPLTLQYDHHRIMRLQEDLQDHIQMSLCLAVFNQQARQIVGPSCNVSSAHEGLKQRIICLTEDDEGNGGAISDHLNAIAIEITRAVFSMRPHTGKQALSLTTFDFNRTTKLLHDVFRNEDVHQTVTNHLLNSMEERVMHFTEQFATMSTLEISNAQKHWAQARAGKDIILAEWDDMARKLAHIGVIHWRVWRDLCYWNCSMNSKIEGSNSINCHNRRDEGSVGASSEKPTTIPSVSLNCISGSNHSVALGPD